MRTRLHQPAKHSSILHNQQTWRLGTQVFIRNCFQIENIRRKQKYLRRTNLRSKRGDEFCFFTNSETTFCVFFPRSDAVLPSLLKIESARLLAEYSLPPGHFPDRLESQCLLRTCSLLLTPYPAFTYALGPLTPFPHL